MAAVDKAHGAGGLVVIKVEERDVLLWRSSVKEKTIDRSQQIRRLARPAFDLAAKGGLQVRHEHGRSYALARHVGQNAGEPPFAQIEEIVVVAANRSGRHTAAGVIERSQRFQLLREQLLLHMAGDVQFALTCCRRRGARRLPGPVPW